MKDYRDRIVVNPKIMLGKPVVKGTRIPVYVLLNLLAEGYNMEKITREYPDLTPQDIAGALQFASDMVSFDEEMHA